MPLSLIISYVERLGDYGNGIHSLTFQLALPNAPVLNTPYYCYEAIPQVVESHFPQNSVSSPCLIFGVKFAVEKWVNSNKTTKARITRSPSENDARTSETAKEANIYFWKE